MTMHDDTLIDWINEAAERLMVEPTPMPEAPHAAREREPLDRRVITAVADLDGLGMTDTFGDVAMIQQTVSTRRRSRLLMVAACFAVVLGGGLLVTWPGEPSVEVATRPILDAPVPVPSGAPKPGESLPYLSNAPAWFGTAAPAERLGGQRSGRWTTAAIGTSRAGSPIVISATDGNLAGLDTAEATTIEGVSVRLLRFGDVSLVASATEPTIVVSGRAPLPVLAEVLTNTIAVDNGVHIALTLAALPVDYEVIAQPQVHAVDLARRRTLTNQASDTSINEVSDWVTPELAAAATGADHEPVSVAGQTAWTGRTNSNPNGTLTFLTWSPEPGVVFEITTSNPSVDIADLIQLAESTRAVGIDEWLAAYPNP